MKKRFLQKCSSICAKTSFAIAAVSGIFLLFTGDNTSEVYKASIGASTFFFFMVGIVLQAIGSANLPSFKPDEITENKG